MALVSMFLFSLIFGVVDFGRGIWTYNALSHAARQGAHYAMVHGSQSNVPATEATIRNIVRSQGILNDIDVTTTWPDGNNEFGNRVRVVAQYTFQPLMSWIGIPSIPLTTTSEMAISY